jgi:hypothetical protein
MRRLFKRDDVTYTVQSVPVGNGYQGVWRCGKCGKSGGSTKTDSSREHAKLSAELNTYQHHVNNHRPKIVMPVVLAAPKK